MQNTTASHNKIVNSILLQKFNKPGPGFDFVKLGAWRKAQRPTFEKLFVALKLGVGVGCKWMSRKVQLCVRGS